jgi:cell division protease FtsH
MDTDPSSRKQAITIGYIFVAGFALVLLQWVLATYNAVGNIPYSQFEQLVAQGQVSEVAVGQDVIQGKVKDKLPSGKSAFITARVDPALAEKLADKGVTVTGVPSGGLLQTILSWVVPAVMFYLVWIFLARRFADRQGFGGLMSIGKSRAKVYVVKDTKVTFADVAGVEEAKFELQEVVSFLKDPKSYGRLGAHVPKGILWSDHRAPARRCLPERLPARRPSHSSRFQAPNSSRCSWASAPPASATCSNRRARPRHASSSSTSLMRLDAAGPPARMAATTKRSRP